mmetsp:Transcript_37819/g.44102  ORF Transcript_37819/g.44102 Transcript_37819/m.44102 type:complete len:470 (-) Transcript_37819:161-1570(-)
MKNISRLLALMLCVAIATIALSATAEEWRSRSIYQILTDRFERTDGGQQPCPNFSHYCGGTFKGIQNRLDYIANLGFDAIWISPVVENIQDGYHGYWASDFYQINHEFGTPADLKELVQAAHEKGIWVMVDVVANHVGPVGMDFSRISIFNSSAHYHARCQIVNWKDQNEVEYCRLSDLPDLDQSNPFVKDTLLHWINYLVTEYEFDGIRIDTIPEINPSFWVEFAKASGTFQIGEAFNDDTYYVGNYQNYLDSVLNYPLYYQLKSQFGYRSSMYNFRSHYDTMSKAFKNQDLLGNFVDNHDNARYLHMISDQRTFKAALAFVMSSRGIPITYYGSEQGYAGGDDPANREPLWTSRFAQNDISAMLKTINQERKQTQWYKYDQIERYVDDSFYAFSRGNTFFAFTNQPDSQQVRTITYHPYPEATTICNIFYPTDCVKVQNGQFKVYLNNGEVKIYVPQTSEEFLSLSI